MNRRQRLAYEAFLEANRSTGWCSRDAALYDDEHLPEFPSPQGPDPIQVIENVCRHRQAEDYDKEWQPPYLRLGKALNFN